MVTFGCLIKSLRIPKFFANCALWSRYISCFDVSSEQVKKVVGKFLSPEDNFSTFLSTLVEITGVLPRLIYLVDPLLSLIHWINFARSHVNDTPITCQLYLVLILPGILLITIMIIQSNAKMIHILVHSLPVGIVISLQ
jgi:hypothetical protein